MKRTEMAQSPAPQRSRLVLSVSAWTLLTLVILGFVMSADIVQEWLRAISTTTVWKIVSSLLLSTTAIVAMSAWISSLIHAWYDPTPLALPRWFLMCILLVGSFAASFFYYFLYVVWTPKGPVASRTETLDADEINA